MGTGGRAPERAEAVRAELEECRGALAGAATRDTTLRRRCARCRRRLGSCARSSRWPRACVSPRSSSEPRGPGARRRRGGGASARQVCRRAGGEGACLARRRDAQAEIAESPGGETTGGDTHSGDALVRPRTLRAPRVRCHRWVRTQTHAPKTQLGSVDAPPSSGGGERARRRAGFLPRQGADGVRAPERGGLGGSARDEDADAERGRPRGHAHDRSPRKRRRRRRERRASGVFPGKKQTFSGAGSFGERRRRRAAA